MSWPCPLSAGASCAAAAGGSFRSAVVAPGSLAGRAGSPRPRGNAHARSKSPCANTAGSLRGARCRKSRPLPLTGQRDWTALQKQSKTFPLLWVAFLCEIWVQSPGYPPLGREMSGRTPKEHPSCAQGAAAGHPPRPPGRARGRRQGRKPRLIRNCAPGFWRGCGHVEAGTLKGIHRRCFFIGRGGGSLESWEGPETNRGDAESASPSDGVDAPETKKIKQKGLVA